MSELKPYEEYKDSVFNEIPIHWNVIALKRILSTKITDGPHETPELYDEGVPFLSAEAIKDSKIDFALKRGNISEQDHIKYSKKCSPKLNDIFMVKSGATTGNLAILDIEKKFSIWSPLALIRVNQYSALPKYVFYFLSSYLFREQVETKWSFGTQQNIGMGVLENLLVLRPKLYEQAQIVKYLDNKTKKIDSLISNKKYLLELLEEKRQAIITETVTKGLDSNVKMKDSGIKWIGEIPEHWEVNPLFSKLTEVKFKNVNLKEQNVLSLSYGRIIRRNVNTNFGLIPASFETYNIINEGNIVMRLTDLQNDKRSLRTGYANEQGIITSAYTTLKLKENNANLAKYYYYLLHSYDLQKIFYGLGDGVRQTMNFNDLKWLPITVPPQDERIQIIKVLDKLNENTTIMLKKIKDQIEKLKEYRESLIYEAVTGKIDLRNYEVESTND